tara:strand:+ start:681 stop:1151 length:471 start_codon:yes stop_codon:yes gene_type:complete
MEKQIKKEQSVENALNILEQSSLNKSELNKIKQHLKAYKFGESIPTSIFSNEISAFESACLYLRNQKMSYRKISILLNKSYNTIWLTVRNAQKKQKKPFKIRSKTQVPLSIFRNQQKTFLKTIITYLKEQKLLTYKEISLLLSRNERTIWTVYNRN